MDIRRSTNGDPTCKICPQYATINMSGQRVRAAYALESVFVGPYHPHCMCTVVQRVDDSPATITAQLQAIMQDNDPTLIPNRSIFQADKLADDLLGAELRPELMKMKQKGWL